MFFNKKMDKRKRIINYTVKSKSKIKVFSKDFFISIDNKEKQLELIINKKTQVIIILKV